MQQILVLYNGNEHARGIIVKALRGVVETVDQLTQQLYDDLEKRLNLLTPRKTDAWPKVLERCTQNLMGVTCRELYSGHWVTRNKAEAHRLLSEWVWRGMLVAIQCTSRGKAGRRQITRYVLPQNEATAKTKARVSTHKWFKTIGSAADLCS
jgi:hypothetical protein